VLWGANILEARLGAELGSAIAEAARSGARVIVIDPRKTMTAKALGARWIPIRPGTDAAMMLAVLGVLFGDGLVDMARASRLATGLEDIERYVSGALDGIVRSPAWAQGICGVPAAVITGFAREYAAARPAMLVPGYSIQRVLNGEETFRLSVALQVATDNFGVAGGSTGSLNNRLPTPALGSLPSLPDAAGLPSPTVPVARWPDAILEGRRGGYPGDIAAAYVAGFNAVSQGGDCRKSTRAMESLEFSVCHEMFMTPTARLCDVVLPVASPLEKEDIGIPWLGNYLLHKRAAVSARGQARSDWDIFGELSERMGCGSAFTGGRTVSGWIDAFIADSEITDPVEFKASGVYFGAERERVGLADFSADPAASPLPTPSGKVELKSDDYARDTGRPAIPTWTDPPGDPRWPFSLITPKTIHRTHSQGGGGASWISGSAEPGAGLVDSGELTLNTADAASLGLAPGEEAIVGNDRGQLRAWVAVSEEIAPGVACLHEGSWIDPGADGIGLGGSVNMLTSTGVTGPAMAPVMHGIPVGIRKA